jgi:hypothetical protein
MIGLITFKKVMSPIILNFLILPLKPQI